MENTKSLVLSESSVKREVLNFLNEDKYNEALRTVDPEGAKKYGVVNATLREYFTDAMNGVTNVAEKGTWARAYVVYNIVEDKNFKKAFKDIEDFGAELNYSKGSISKMCTAVRIREYIRNNGLQYTFTTGQIEPLAKDFNRCRKLSLSFGKWLKDTGITDTMSVNEIRDSIKDYNNKIAGVSEEPKKSDKNSNTPSVSADQTSTSSVSAYQTNTSSVSAYQTNTVDKAVNQLLKTTEDLEFSFKRKAGKPRNCTIKVSPDNAHKFFRLLIELDMITLD